MDVREKLVELLDNVVSYEYDTEELVNSLIAHGVTVQEWIPVTERLPEEEGLYLVAVVNDHERRYSKTAWYHGREKWFSNQKVTHWKPLPKPPKGE